MKAFNKFWSKQLVSEIKTKICLKYFPVDNLRINTSSAARSRLDSIGHEKKDHKGQNSNRDLLTAKKPGIHSVVEQ